MGMMDDLGNLEKRLASGDVSDSDVHDAYDRTARTVPRAQLADGLHEAFRSDQTPPFDRMVSGLYGQSNPEQKAGLLNQLLGALGSGGAASLGSAGGLGAALAGLLSGGRVTPQQAQQVSPEQVEVLAQHAARKDPTIMEKAAGFYAEHPTLVKAIGASALAFLMSRMSAARR